MLSPEEQLMHHLNRLYRHVSLQLKSFSVSSAWFRTRTVVVLLPIIYHIPPTKALIITKVIEIKLCFFSFVTGLDLLRTTKYTTLPTTKLKIYIRLAAIRMNALKCRTLATKMCIHACIHLSINKKITLNIINN